jgi:hypothetical protein
MRKFAAVAATAVLTAVGAVATASPAEAAYANPIFICNNVESDGYIKAYNDDTLQEWMIGPNYCATVNDKNGMARVDVDPAGGVDIDSYKKRKVPDGYGPCYVSENGASNPYSGYQVTTVYMVSVNEFCL